MNKPNENQLKILRVIHKNVHYWEGTNDINSPTHFSDMGETFSQLAEETNINSEQLQEIYEKMREILSIIRQVQHPNKTVRILDRFKYLDK